VIWGSVPQRNKNFTGREDILQKIRQSISSAVAAVLPDAGSNLPQALQGMGGVGKTAVAVEYAYRYRSEYDVVWWIPADQPALVRSSLAALAEPLRLPPAGIETSATTVLDALRRGQPYSRWLLVFDNADQPEDLMGFLPSGPGDVLVTSRNHRWHSVAESVPVDVFSRAESTAFLTKRVSRGLDQTDALRLAEDLGDLPLALEQAGALQAETGMSVEQYLRLLKEHTAEIMAEGRGLEYPQSMTAAWNVSVSQLSQHLPEAMELLRCCAFFGPEPIPVDLFRRSTQATETRIRDLLANPILLARAIRELARFALVKIDGRAIVVHRLIQALLREAIDEAERPSYQHDAHLILAAGGPKDPDDSRLWPRYAELVAHIASPATGLANCHDGAVRDLALDIVRYLSRSGNHESSRLLAERFISQWIHDSGQDDRSVLTMQRHLGDTLRELGSYSEANGLDETTLGRVRRVLGEQDPLALTLTNSLAADLRARGEFAAARKLDRTSLELHQQVLGSENPHTLRVMNNLAIDHGLNGDYWPSRELHQKTYVLQSEAQIGVSFSEVLNSWNGLARAVRLCSDFTEARDLGEDAYDYGKAQLGVDHFLTLRTAKDLSIAMRLTGVAYDEALELAQEVRALSVQLRPGRPDTLAAEVSLTNVQRVMGQTGSLLPQVKASVTAYDKVYGQDHPYSQACRGNLALLHRMLGDPAAARQIDEAALAGLHARLGRDHDYSLTVAVNLASDLAELGDTAAACALGEDTLPRLLRVMGPENALTLGCAANLALDLSASGAEERAQELSADTQARYPLVLGSGHPDVIAAADGRRIGLDFDPPPI
jgi:hypothetical protein